MVQVLGVVVALAIGGLAVDREQSTHRIRLGHRQVHKEIGVAVAGRVGLRVVMMKAHGHLHPDAPLRCMAAIQPLPHPTCDPGEHDIVDRDALPVGLSDALEIGQRDGGESDAAGGADMPVER